MKSILLHTLLVIVALPSLAAPPQIGGKAPDFSLKSLKGAAIRLSDLNAGGPVVLVVLRGYPGYQCPACNQQVQDYLRNAGDFAAAGAQVLLVYPGPGANLDARAREFTAGKKFPDHFELVLDPDYEFTNLYDLRWNAPNETAYPATFVIDRSGKVVYAKISSSHGGRSKAADVLPLLRGGN